MNANALARTIRLALRHKCQMTNIAGSDTATLAEALAGENDLRIIAAAVARFAARRDGNVVDLRQSRWEREILEMLESFVALGDALGHNSAAG